MPLIRIDEGDGTFSYIEVPYPGQAQQQPFVPQLPQQPQIPLDLYTLQQIAASINGQGFTDQSAVPPPAPAPQFIRTEDGFIPNPLLPPPPPPPRLPPAGQGEVTAPPPQTTFVPPAASGAAGNLPALGGAAIPGGFGAGAPDPNEIRKGITGTGTPAGGAGGFIEDSTVPGGLTAEEIWRRSGGKPSGSEVDEIVRILGGGAPPPFVQPGGGQPGAGAGLGGAGGGTGANPPTNLFPPAGGVPGGSPAPSGFIGPLGGLEETEPGAAFLRGLQRAGVDLNSIAGRARASQGDDFLRAFAFGSLLQGFDPGGQFLRRKDKEGLDIDSPLGALPLGAFEQFTSGRDIGSVRRNAAGSLSALLSGQAGGPNTEAASFLLNQFNQPDENQAGELAGLAKAALASRISPLALRLLRLPSGGDLRDRFIAETGGQGSFLDYFRRNFPVLGT